MLLNQSKLNEIWKTVLINIKNKNIFEDSIFKTYINDSKLIDINFDNIATIEVPWELHKNFFNNYLSEFEAEISNLLDVDINLKIIVSGSEELTSINYNNTTQLTKDTINEIFKTANHISKFYTFENFIQGSSNEKPYAAAYGSAISNEPNFYNPIFIYGNSGLGKTHLLHAICNYLQDNRSEVTFLYIDGNDLIAELINATKNRTVNKIIEQLSHVNYLLIDDIQHLAKTNDTQEVFFNLYNKIIDNNGQIILTSDVYPAELKSMNNRLISRFTSGLSVCIDPPEFSTAVSILNKKISLSKQKLNITDEAITYIAQNYSNDVRQLEGAFNDILFNSILFKADIIDLEFVKQALKEKPKKVVKLDNKGLTPKIIKREVCNYYNITINQIESKSRTLNISNPRKIAIYLCRELLNMPYEKIGKEFGNRDHSTIMSNYNNFVKLMNENSEYKQTIENLKEILNS